jgi:hypothetical protein
MKDNIDIKSATKTLNLLFLDMIRRKYTYGLLIEVSIASLRYDRTTW